MHFHAQTASVGIARQHAKGSVQGRGPRRLRLEYILPQTRWHRARMCTLMADDRSSEAPRLGLWPTWQKNAPGAGLSVSLDQFLEVVDYHVRAVSEQSLPLPHSVHADHQPETAGATGGDSRQCVLDDDGSLRRHA